ncbi:MAG: DUF3786 domain-containing protein [Thermoplasmata archaeon]|nr:MAG: DUF3786 domain-containing protein [Thermoplasmata archaeon]
MPRAIYHFAEGRKLMSQPKEKVTYEAAISKAWEDLASRDLQDVAKMANVPWDSEKGEFRLIFLGIEYRISLSNRTVQEQNGQDVYPFLAVLLLHYLVNVKDIGPQGKLISFRELEGGDVYYSAFCARAINPITESFGAEPDALKEVGERIGAEQGDLGDISIIIDVFPKIPVTIILWKGDDEVPASSNMLFDSSIREHLPTEDVAVIGGFVASMLVKSMKNLE